MTSTLTPACPLCGLRYASKPLLELHIREDHRPRRRTRPGRPGDAGGTRASSPPPGRPSRRTGPAAGPSRTAKEVNPMTAARHPRTGQVLTVARRGLRALRLVNDELTRASEAIIRSARAPHSRPPIQAPAARDTAPGTAADRGARAA
jgi:hypothetical protein